MLFFFNFASCEPTDYRKMSKRRRHKLLYYAVCYQMSTKNVLYLIFFGDSDEKTSAEKSLWLPGVCGFGLRLILECLTSCICEVILWTLSIQVFKDHLRSTSFFCQRHINADYQKKTYPFAFQWNKRTKQNKKC